MIFDVTRCGLLTPIRSALRGFLFIQYFPGEKVKNVEISIISISIASKKKRYSSHFSPTSELIEYQYMASFSICRGYPSLYKTIRQTLLETMVSVEEILQGFSQTSVSEEASAMNFL